MANTYIYEFKEEALEKALYMYKKTKDIICVNIEEKKGLEEYRKMTSAVEQINQETLSKIEEYSALLENQREKINLLSKAGIELTQDHIDPILNGRVDVINEFKERIQKDIMQSLSEVGISTTRDDINAILNGDGNVDEILVKKGQELSEDNLSKKELLDQEIKKYQEQIKILNEIGEGAIKSNQLITDVDNLNNKKKKVLEPLDNAIKYVDESKKEKIDKNKKNNLWESFRDYIRPDPITKVKIQAPIAAALVLLSIASGGALPLILGVVAGMYACSNILNDIVGTETMDKISITNGVQALYNKCVGNNKYKDADIDVLDNVMGEQINSIAALKNKFMKPEEKGENEKLKKEKGTGNVKKEITGLNEVVENIQNPSQKSNPISTEQSNTKKAILYR
jgi:hypothetical protein